MQSLKQVQYSGEWTFSVDKSFILNPDINIEAKAVYLALKSFCAPGMPTAFPSINTLQTCLNLSRGRLYKYLRELNDLGLLVREQTSTDDGKFSVALYTLKSCQNSVGGESAHGKAILGSPSPTTPTSTLPVLVGKELPGKETPKERQLAEKIYSHYPRKVGRPLAVRAIIKAFRRGVKPDALLGHVKKYAAMRNGEEPRYTPHPATWFNQERYMDDPATWGNGKLEQHQEGDRAGEINGRPAFWRKLSGKWVRATS